jgi:hypothetical protein
VVPAWGQSGASEGSNWGREMKMVPVKVKLEPRVAVEMKQWAESEGRSRTRHTEILLRKLAGLRETNPDDLIRLGLLDQRA